MLGTAAAFVRDPGGLVVALVAAVLVVLGLEGRLVAVEPFGGVPLAFPDLLEVAVGRMLEDDAGVPDGFGTPLDGLDQQFAELPQLVVAGRVDQEEVVLLFHFASPFGWSSLAFMLRMRA